MYSRRSSSWALAPALCAVFPCRLRCWAPLSRSSGAAFLCNEALALGRERWRRRDRFDLRLLDDTRPYAGPSRDDPGVQPEAPDWESVEGVVVYCHRCDVSMPTFHSICPKCGCPLGH